MSWRLAPSIAQPNGIPSAPAMIDHFQPERPRSVGFRACCLSAVGRLVLRAVQAHLGQVELDDAVIGGQGLGGGRVEHTGGDPLVSARSQRCVRDAPAH